MKSVFYVFRFRFGLALLLTVLALGSAAGEALASEAAAKPQRPFLSGLFQRGARAQPEPGSTGSLRSRGDTGELSRPQARQSRARGKAQGTRAANRTSLVRDNSGVRINRHALSRSNLATNRVVVDIAKQRAYLLVEGAVAIETPISTARPGKRTPRGRFSVTERVRSNKVSTIYGVAMPYWMRLNNTVFGLHAGHLPGYPASAGCVRLHPNAAPLIFDHTRRGTRVDIYSSWSGI